MIVRVLSQYVFNSTLEFVGISDDNVEDYKSSAFISIIGTNPGEKSYFNKDHRNVMRLVFDDASPGEISPDGREMIVFDSTHAQSIKNFLNQNSSVKELFVHCSAGYSRSGAVGLFANDIHGEEDYFTFMKSNGQIKPNPHITSILNEQFYQ